MRGSQVHRWGSTYTCGRRAKNSRLQICWWVSYCFHLPSFHHSFFPSFIFTQSPYLSSYIPSLSSPSFLHLLLPHPFNQTHLVLTFNYYCCPFSSCSSSFLFLLLFLPTFPIFSQVHTSMFPSPAHQSTFQYFVPVLLFLSFFLSQLFLYFIKCLLPLLHYFLLTFLKFWIIFIFTLQQTTTLFFFYLLFFYSAYYFYIAPNFTFFLSLWASPLQSFTNLRGFYNFSG